MVALAAGSYFMLSGTIVWALVILARSGFMTSAG